MSNSSLNWIYLLLAVLLPMINVSWARGVNGGSDCAICTIVMGVTEHLSILYNESIIASLERLCNYLPNDFRAYCEVAVEFLGEFLF
jgi:acyloxyacyl hydrolase